MQIAPLGRAPTAIPPPVLAEIALIHEVPPADLFRLTQLWQPKGSTELRMRVDELKVEIGKAISDERIEWAVGRFIEAVTADPARVEELRSEPEFEPIRDNIDQLMARLTHVARMDAETKLAIVAQVLETNGWKKLAPWETTPEVLVHIGYQVLETGGYVNYIRTAELATALQSAYLAGTLLQPQLPIEGMSEVSEGAEAADTPRAEPSRGLVARLWNKLRERVVRYLSPTDTAS